MPADCRTGGRALHPHEFWQAFLPPAAWFPAPYVDRFPARVGDAVLMLPIRPLAGTETAIASLILTQASFAVEARLADLLAAHLAPCAPEVVVGLPTLGLPLARAVAERLGHARYVALGTSRKFWYDDALSVPLRSITSPDATKRLYLDPRMRPLLAGRRLALIDDVISTGSSIGAGLDLLEIAGLRPEVVGAAMLQTRRWSGALSRRGVTVRGAFESPLLVRGPAGWHPVPDGPVPA